MAEAGKGEALVAEMVFPAIANHYGTLFAGEALKLMSKAAFIAASREAHGSVVMASVEHTDFKEPVPLGNLAEVTGRVIARGATSLTVATELYSENFATGERRLCVVASFIMVAVDAGGRPVSRNAPAGT
jgi:acyl-CoA hydrolase